VYLCKICRSVIGPNIPALLIPTVVRKRKYPPRPKANKLIDPRKPGKRHVIRIDDPGGEGRETVKELRVCAACAERAPPPSLK
jgi:hypothetical protein